MNSLAVIAGQNPPDETGPTQAVLRSSWIPTFSGRAFDVVDPSSRDISIRDIAHSLSMQCRFGGHCRRFYSLAEHGLLLSRTVDRKLALCALLHESAHAYIQEVIIPLRPLLAGYQELTSRVWAMVAKRFRLPLVLPAAIRQADFRLLATEIEYLLLPTPKPWLQGVNPFTLEELGVQHTKQLGLLPREARQLFLERFAELVI
jgi:hypothetical protein